MRLALSNPLELLSMRALLGGTLLLIASGCVFFEVPKDRATELLLTPVHSRLPASAKDVPARFAGPSDPGWRDVQLGLRAWSSKKKECVEREAETTSWEKCWIPVEFPKAKGEELLVEFLLISDAQTRDERAYEPGQLRWIDYFVEPTIRLPLVEVMDGVVLQAFVSAYRQDVERNAKSGKAASHFLIQGGDLLDVSLVTELVEAYETLSSVAAARDCDRCPLNSPTSKEEPGLTVYSVVGNHDGLTWGNLSDEMTTTWELGINRTEFVLGGILYSPDEQGFGFAENEIIKGLEGRQEQLRKALPETSEALDRIHRYKQTFLKRDKIRERDKIEVPPITVKGIISVSRKEDSNQLGYYSFNQDELRFIVLDTASKNSVVADIDPVQLGWLYLQLKEAWQHCQPVILISHHGPRNFLWYRRSTLTRILKQFPNIVLYLHGHGHEAGVDVVGKVPVVETPSIIDYPEVGSLVRIFRRDNSSLRISVSLVRPDVLTDSLDAMSLQSLLDETWINSYYDDRSRFRSWYGPHRAVSWRDITPLLSTPQANVADVLTDVNGSLEIVWQPQCGKGRPPPPSAADFFGSQTAADRSKQMRYKLGLTVRNW